jgi:hypothetical protein
MSNVYAVWVGFGWTAPFLWKRFATMLALGVAPAAACVAMGYGVPGLLVMALGLWPFPWRLTISPRGLTCRWLFVRELIPFTQIATARLIKDPRRFTMFRRHVLALSRPTGRELLIFGKEATLVRVLHDIDQRRSQAA